MTRTIAPTIRRYPLISYFAIASALSSAYVIVLLSLKPPDTLVTFTPEDFGPALAALVVTALSAGRPGVKRWLASIVCWRVGVHWYVLTFVGAPLIYMAGVVFVPGALASFTVPAPSRILLYPLFFLVVLLVGGPLFEEPGWRGFALPRMQKRWGALVAALLLGVLWAGWHMPQYLLPGFAAQNGGFTPAGIGTFAAGAISFSVVLAWVFNHTRGSVLIAVLLHTSINFGQGVTSDFFPKLGFNEVGGVIAFGIAALVIVMATRGRLGYRAATPEETPMPLARARVASPD